MNTKRWTLLTWKRSRLMPPWHRVDPYAGCATHTEYKCNRQSTNQSYGEGKDNG